MTELVLEGQLALPRCPYCGVDRPSLAAKQSVAVTQTYTEENTRYWKMYVCQRCGGIVLAASDQKNGDVREYYPTLATVDEAIPEPARTYLHQAMESLHTPAGAVMLCASAVDAMLKAKDLREGSLYTRINLAVKDHLITAEMAQWAHEVRLDANEPRHADEKAPLPSEDEARKCVDFVQALAEFLFVLPSRVTRGLAEASDS